MNEEELNEDIKEALANIKFGRHLLDQNEDVAPFGSIEWLTSVLKQTKDPLLRQKYIELYDLQ